jgi:hypothetical protein
LSHQAEVTVSYDSEKAKAVPKMAGTMTELRLKSTL